MNVKKLGSPSNHHPPSPPPLIELLQWVFGEKRAFFSSFNFLLCSLQTPPSSYSASSASVLLGLGFFAPRLLKFSTCSGGSLRLVQPRGGGRVRVGLGVSHFIKKAELLMHASRVLTLPKPLCLPGSFKALHSDRASLRAARRRRRVWRRWRRRRSCVDDGARRPIVLLHKEAEGDGRLLEKQSHPGGAIIFPPAISPICG